MAGLKFTAFLLLASTIGCGGSSSSFNPSFDNRTSIPTSTLQGWWNEAQTRPYVKDAQDQTIANWVTIPADPRAVNVYPDGVIYEFSDRSSSCLHGNRGMTWYGDPETVCIDQTYMDRITANYYGSQQTLKELTIYEFQNVIYHRLGYDMTGR